MSLPLQVCKVPTTASFMTYDFSMFRHQLQLAVQQRRSYEDLYGLTQLCHIRVSFVKGARAPSSSPSVSGKLVQNITSNDRNFHWIIHRQNIQ